MILLLKLMLLVLVLVLALLLTYMPIVCCKVIGGKYLKARAAKATTLKMQFIGLFCLRYHH